MGMKEAQKAVENQKPGKYIKLEDDGDSCVICLPFMGDDPSDDPYVYEYAWNDKTNSSEPYTAEHRAQDLEPNSKFFFTAFEKNEGPKVFSCTTATYKDILAHRVKFKSLDRVFVEIKRAGPKGSKKTRYKVMFDSEVDETTKSKFASIKRFDLKAEATGTARDEKEDHSSKSNGSSRESGPTIASDLADKLLARIRPLPEEKRDQFKAFVNKHGFGSVRQLPQSLLGEFEALLGKLEGKTVEDPFA